MISSLFLKLFGKKGLVKSVKVLPASIKRINPIQKYPHITDSYASKNICYYVFISKKFCDFFWSVFNSKTVK